LITYENLVQNLTYQWQETHNDHVLNLFGQFYRQIVASRDDQPEEKSAKNGVNANQLRDPGRQEE